MFEKLDVIRMAQAMASHAGKRQAVVAQNVANADTPGYKARDIVPFAQTYEGQTPLKVTHAKHFAANGPAERWTPYQADLPASANGNSVNLEEELFRSVDIKRSHDRALAIYEHSLNIVRSSLGRR